MGMHDLMLGNHLALRLFTLHLGCYYVLPSFTNCHPGSLLAYIAHYGQFLYAKIITCLTRERVQIDSLHDITKRSFYFYLSAVERHKIRRRKIWANSGIPEFANWTRHLALILPLNNMSPGISSAMVPDVESGVLTERDVSSRGSLIGHHCLMLTTLGKAPQSR